MSRFFTVLTLMCIVGGLAFFFYFHGSIEEVVGFRPRDEDIFSGAFATPISSISDLCSGGSCWMGMFIWIKFKSGEPVILKDQDQFVKGSADQARKLFLEMAPDASELQKMTNLECLEKRGGTISYWLLSNKQNGCYWYCQSEDITP